MRFNKMNNDLRKNALNFYQILPTNSLRKCMQIRNSKGDAKTVSLIST